LTGRPPNGDVIENPLNDRRSCRIDSDFDLTRDLAVSEVEDYVLDAVASVRKGHEEGEDDPHLAGHLV
jgi:hypothetical protein